MTRGKKHGLNWQMTSNIPISLNLNIANSSKLLLTTRLLSGCIFQLLVVGLTTLWPMRKTTMHLSWLRMKGERRFPLCSLPTRCRNIKVVSIPKNRRTCCLFTNSNHPSNTFPWNLTLCDTRTHYAHLCLWNRTSFSKKDTTKNRLCVLIVIII